jgi:nicotinamidase-related amidase
MKKTSKAKEKQRKIILLAVIGVVIIFIAAVVMTGLHLITPTKGAYISVYTDPNSALLVIDVQNDITSNTGTYGDTAAFVREVNRAIAIAEESGMEILYMKNEYDSDRSIMLLSGGKFQRGTMGVEFDSGLRVVNNNVFTKSIGDGFSSKEFEKYLISHSVDTLYIVGADAAACVYKTAQGGINRNYSVFVIKDAITTRGESVLTQMLEQYEKEGIGVIDMADWIKLNEE